MVSEVLSVCLLSLSRLVASSEGWLAIWSIHVSNVVFGNGSKTPDLNVSLLDLSSSRNYNNAGAPCLCKRLSELSSACTRAPPVLNPALRHAIRLSLSVHTHQHN